MIRILFNSDDFEPRVVDLLKAGKVGLLNLAQREALQFNHGGTDLLWMAATGVHGYLFRDVVYPRIELFATGVGIFCNAGGAI